MYQFGANSDGIYEAIDEIEKSEISQMRQTAKAETYVRFSQQLNTRANSVTPAAFSAFIPPAPHKRATHQGQQFKSMSQGR